MNYNVNEKGYYGDFGGAFIPEMLYPNVAELRDNYLEITRRADFKKEFENADRIQKREIFERYCNSNKAQTLLNWAPKVKLDQGIKKIIKKGVIFERWEHLYDEQN